MQSEEDIRKDLKLFEKFFQRLTIAKEREIALARTGKMLASGEIKDMKELAVNIESLFGRNSTITNFRLKKIFEAEKSKYELNMKGWKNRKDYALQAFERMLKSKKSEEQ